MITFFFQHIPLAVVLVVQSSGTNLRHLEKGLTHREPCCFSDVLSWCSCVGFSYEVPLGTMAALLFIERLQLITAENVVPGTSVKVI